MFIYCSLGCWLSVKANKTLCKSAAMWIMSSLLLIFLSKLLLFLLSWSLLPAHPLTVLQASTHLWFGGYLTAYIQRDGVDYCGCGTEAWKVGIFKAWDVMADLNNANPNKPWTARGQLCMLYYFVVVHGLRSMDLAIPALVSLCSLPLRLIRHLWVYFARSRSSPCCSVL